MLCQLSYAGILYAESLQRNEKTIYMLHAYKANRRVATGSMRIRINSRMLCQLSYAGILYAESLQRNEKTIYMLHAYKANRRVATGSMRIRHADRSSLPVDLDDPSPLGWMRLLHYTPSGLAVPLDRCDTNRCSTGPVDGSHSTAPVDLDDPSPLGWMRLLHYTPSGLAVPLDRCDTNRCSTGPVDGSHSTACASTGGRGIANPYNSFEYPHNPRMFTHIAICKKPPGGGLVAPATGLEPVTVRLTVGCSAN